MKNEIRNCLTWMANRVAETTTYETWSDELKAREIKEASRSFYDELGKHIDVTKLTVAEAKELRFKKWDEDQPDLYLFPLWIVPLIPEGMTLYSLDGEQIIYHKNEVDNDIRFGCVAYGIIIKEKYEEEK